MLRLQYFYNIFTTNYKWLVVIGSNVEPNTNITFLSQQ